jgi:hypothetical protein
MGTFLITTPDGKKYKVSGESHEGALAALQKALGKSETPATPVPGVGEDMAKSGAVGFGKGVVDLGTMFGSAGQVSEDLASGAAKMFGAGDTTASYIGKGARMLGGPLTMGPSSDDVIGTVEQATGPLPKPQTVPGEYAEQGMRFVGSSLAGPESLLVRAGTGLLAGLTSKFAERQTEGSPLQPVAEVGGALVGGSLPSLMKSGWNKVRMMLRGADEKAASVLIERLAQSGMTPDDAAAKIQEMGPEAMLADVSPNMQVATGGTAVADPAAQQTIATRLAVRREGAPQRVSNLLDQSFGPYKGPQMIADEIKSARAPAGPAYELAKTHVVDPEPALGKIDELLKTYGPGSDIGQSLQGFKNQLLDGKGNVIGQGNIVHGIREQLDDAISGAYNSGAGKKAGRLKEVRDEIDKVLKSQIPGFKEADQLWSETAKLEKAYQYGQRDLLTKKVYPDQSAKTLEKMSDPEFEAARQGVRAKLAMDFSGAAKNPTVGVERALNASMNDQKVPQLIGQGRTQALSKGLDTEATFIETSALGEPSRGSRTAVLDSSKEMWGNSSKPSMMGDMLAGTAAGATVGGPGGGLAGGAAAFTNGMRLRLANAFTAKSKPAVIQAAADFLTATGGNRQKAIDLMRKVAATLPKKTASQDAIRAMTNALLTLKSAVPAAQGR